MTSASPSVESNVRFRRTLVRVMIVQIVALLLLWWLQRTYTP
jgi:hypothetical protein